MGKRALGRLLDAPGSSRGLQGALSASGGGDTFRRRDSVWGSKIYKQKYTLTAKDPKQLTKGFCFLFFVFFVFVFLLLCFLIKKEPLHDTCVVIRYKAI